MVHRHLHRLLIAVLVPCGACAALVPAADAGRFDAAAAKCSTTAPGTLPAGPSTAQSKLVPAGPTSVLLCRYRGLNDPTPSDAHVLAGTATVSDAHTVSALTGAFDAAPPASTGTTATSCPADDGAEVVARFTYLGRSPDIVETATTGCPTASNGAVTAVPSEPLIAELDALTGCSPPAAQPQSVLCDGDPVPPALATTPQSSSSTSGHRRHRHRRHRHR